MDIASAIALIYQKSGGDVFTVQIVPPGWIYLELTDSSFSDLVAKSRLSGNLDEAGEMGRKANSNYKSQM